MGHFEMKDLGDSNVGHWPVFWPQKYVSMKTTTLWYMSYFRHAERVILPSASKSVTWNKTHFLSSVYVPNALFFGCWSCFLRVIPSLYTQAERIIQKDLRATLSLPETANWFFTNTTVFRAIRSMDWVATWDPTLQMWCLLKEKAGHMPQPL